MRLEQIRNGELIIEDERDWAARKLVQFFKRMKLRPDVGLALRVVSPASRLPKSYLEGICDGAREGKFDPKTVALSASLVCRFVRDLADEPERHDHRIYAIQSLRSVRNEEVLGLLMELKGVCGVFSMNKDLKAVRKTATEVLDYHMSCKG